MTRPDTLPAAHAAPQATRRGVDGSGYGLGAGAACGGCAGLALGASEGEPVACACNIPMLQSERGPVVGSGLPQAGMGESPAAEGGIAALPFAPGAVGVKPGRPHPLFLTSCGR